MKLIKAYIRPQVLEQLYIALRKQGCTSITVTNVQGTGCYIHPEHRHSSLEFPAEHTELNKIEMVVADEMVDRMVPLILEKAHTGHNGDGIIYVSPVERAVRIEDAKEQLFNTEAEA